MGSTGKPKEAASSEAIPFDDCLRILVNTLPKPKKAEPQAGEGEKGQGDKKAS